MSQKQPSFSGETARLRRVAGNPNVHVFYGKHARTRMIERHISELDVKHILGRCPVVRVEPHLGSIRWNVRGKDLDGRNVELVVIVNEDDIEITVVTVIEKLGATP